VPNDSATDQASLLALQQGDAAALNRLIARWQRPLHGFAYRYCQNQTDAEDLVAQTFVRLYQQRLRFKADTKLSAWLFTTLTNLCHNHHRWKKRHPTINLETSSSSSDTSANQGLAQDSLASEQMAPDRALEHDEVLASVRAAIARLPHDLKIALLLHHYDHLSYREISEITGCSERGVETRLYRARLQLRDMLSAQIPQATHR
jgi:RNA polymerase sigma-70 factor (ECF subfamily)